MPPAHQAHQVSVLVQSFGIVLYILSIVPPFQPPQPQPHPLFNAPAHPAQPAHPIADIVPVKLYMKAAIRISHPFHPLPQPQPPASPLPVPHQPPLELALPL